MKFQWMDIQTDQEGRKYVVMDWQVKYLKPKARVLDIKEDSNVWTVDAVRLNEQDAKERFWSAYWSSPVYKKDTYKVKTSSTAPSYMQPKKPEASTYTPPVQPVANVEKTKPVEVNLVQQWSNDVSAFKLPEPIIKNGTISVPLTPQQSLQSFGAADKAVTATKDILFLKNNADKLKEEAKAYINRMSWVKLTNKEDIDRYNYYLNILK